MSGTAVIGDFRFLEQPSPHNVTLELELSPSGERLGTLRFGSEVQSRLDAIGFPAKQEALPLASALPYAIAVAMQVDADLALTGDPSVWDPRWGMLRNIEFGQVSCLKHRFGKVSFGKPL